MDPGTQLATYDDLVALPEQARAEILRGRVVVLPPGLPRESRARCVLSAAIGGPFDDEEGRGGPGGWWIFLGVLTRFTRHDVVWPDLSGWRRERLPDPWDMAPIDVRPDWICEVLSPSNQAHDRVTKRHLYAEHGVPFYWLVDPAERTLEALRLHEGIWVDAGTFDETATARIPPFEAVELEVGRLFPPPA